MVQHKSECQFLRETVGFIVAICIAQSLKVFSKVMIASTVSIATHFEFI